jgi:hypothetical protein
MKLLIKIITLTLMIFSLNLISAQLSFDLQNEKLQPGETLFAKLNGNISEKIKYPQIEFFEGQRKIPLDFELEQFKDKYYFYAYIGNTGNFTLKIKDVFYYDENSNLQSKTIQQNISVNKLYLDENKTQTQILSIKPGLLKTNENTIELENKGTEQINLTYEFENSIKELILNPEEKNVIQINPTKFSLLKINTYKIFEIPIIFEKSFLVSDSGLEYPEKIEVISIAEEKQTHYFELKNSNAENLIQNLIFTFPTGFVELKTKTTSILPNTTQIIEFTIDSEDPNALADFITISFEEFVGQTYEQKIIQIPMKIFVLPKETNQTQIKNFKPDENSCQNLNGQVCDTTQSCNGTSSITQNAEYCCLGLCQTKTIEDDSDKSSSRKLKGIIIFAILVIIGIALFFQFKKIKTPTAKDELEKRNKSYEKKFKK